MWAWAILVLHKLVGTMLSALVIQALSCLRVYLPTVSTQRLPVLLLISRPWRISEENGTLRTMTLLFVTSECCLKHSLFPVSCASWSSCFSACVTVLWLCATVGVCARMVLWYRADGEERVCLYISVSDWVSGESPLDFTSLNTEECTKTSGSIQRCSFLKVYLVVAEHSFSLHRFEKKPFLVILWRLKRNPYEFEVTRLNSSLHLRSFNPWAIQQAFLYKNRWLTYVSRVISSGEQTWCHRVSFLSGYVTAVHARLFFSFKNI